MSGRGDGTRNAPGYVGPKRVERAARGVVPPGGGKPGMKLPRALGRPMGEWQILAGQGLLKGIR